MNDTIKKVLATFLGIIISFTIPFLGIFLTNIFNNSVPVILSLIILPFLGYITFKSKYKYLAMGIFIGLIPIGIIAFTLITVSRLH